MDPADAGRHSGHHRTRPYDQCYYLTFSLVKIMHLGPHAWQSVVLHLKLCLCTKAEMLHFFVRLMKLHLCVAFLYTSPSP